MRKTDKNQPGKAGATMAALLADIKTCEKDVLNPAAWILHRELVSRRVQMLFPRKPDYSHLSLLDLHDAIADQDGKDAISRHARETLQRELSSRFMESLAAARQTENTRFLPPVRRPYPR